MLSTCPNTTTTQGQTLIVNRLKTKKKKKNKVGFCRPFLVLESRFSLTKTEDNRRTIKQPEIAPYTIFSNSLLSLKTQQDCS